jgi:uncharacterized protein YlxW (UPF0749 family)
MNAEKINLLAVLDDRIDSLRRMSPAIESEVAKAVQAQTAAIALLTERESLLEENQKLKDEVEALTKSLAAYKEMRRESEDRYVDAARHPNPTKSPTDLKDAE